MASSLHDIDAALSAIDGAARAQTASSSISSSVRAIDNVLETRQRKFEETRTCVASLLDSLSLFARSRMNDLTGEDVHLLKKARDLGNKWNVCTPVWTT